MSSFKDSKKPADPRTERVLRNSRHRVASGEKKRAGGRKGEGTARCKKGKKRLKNKEPGGNVLASIKVSDRRKPTSSERAGATQAMSKSARAAARVRISKSRPRKLGHAAFTMRTSPLRKKEKDQKPTQSGCRIKKRGGGESRRTDQTKSGAPGRTCIESSTDNSLT